MKNVTARIGKQQEPERDLFCKKQMAERVGVYQMLNADNLTYPNMFFFTIHKSGRYATFSVDDRDGIELVTETMWDTRKFREVTNKTVTITWET